MLPWWRANTISMRNLHSSYTFSPCQSLLIYGHIIKGHQKVPSWYSFRIRMLFSFEVTLLRNLKHYYVTIDNYLWKRKTLQWNRVGRKQRLSETAVKPNRRGLHFSGRYWLHVQTTMRIWGFVFNWRTHIDRSVFPAHTRGFKVVSINSIAGFIGILL